MASTKPVEVTFRKARIVEIKSALEILDNPNSATPNAPGEGKPTKWKFKNQSATRYALAMAYRTVAEAFTVTNKVRLDIVRNKQDEQLNVLPDTDNLTGRCAQEASRELDKMFEEEITLALHQVKLSDLDLEANAIPFTIVGLLIGTVIVDDIADTKENDADAD